MPAGHTPAPGTTSVIETDPPTVTVPDLRRLATSGFPVGEMCQVDCGSNANTVFAPTAASGRIRIDTVRIG